MEGVILFADDNIFDTSRIENKLFQKFNSDGNYAVLPLNNLSNLEKTISSISTYKALILDWNFNRVTEEDDIKLPDENPYQFLKSSKIYSLVYIYSQADIDDEIKSELNGLYPGKIFFESKNADNQVDVEFEKILLGIKQFEDQNLHLAVPFIWSKAINTAAQNIFSEFEIADKYWIKELYYSSVRKYDKATGEAKEVEIEPTIEVINLFQNILLERITQNVELVESIKKYSIDNFKQEISSASIINLYSKLYYTKTLESDTVMTGDIYKLQEGCFGVIISPECDMNKLIKKNELVELLCFSENDFAKISDFCKSEDEIKRAYNQEIAALHLLPIFPFSKEIIKTGLIDFRFSLKLIKGKYLETNRNARFAKINSPYIQQIRQRYLAYIGRVGVPAIPDSLKFSK